MIETPLIEVTDLEAVYAGVRQDSGQTADPRALARTARRPDWLISGSYYLSGDSVLFQASIMDVASGRTLRSFDPAGAPVERATDALADAAGADRGRSQPAGQFLEPGLPRRSRPGRAAEPASVPGVRGGAQAGKTVQRLAVGGPALSTGCQTGFDLRRTAHPARIRRSVVRPMLGHRLHRRRARSPSGPVDSVGSHDPGPAGGQLPRRQGEGAGPPRTTVSARILTRSPGRLTMRGPCKTPINRGPRGRSSGGWFPSATWGGWCHRTQPMPSTGSTWRRRGTCWADIGPSSTSLIGGATPQTRSGRSRAVARSPPSARSDGSWNSLRA